MSLGIASKLTALSTKLLTKLPTPVARTIGKATLAATQASPIIFAVGGGILTIAAVIEAAKSTPAFLEELDAYNDMLDKQKEYVKKVEEGEIVPEEPYTKKQQTQDRLSIYAKIMVSGIKHYGKAMIMVGGSFACYGMALKILNGWLAGATAALAAKTEELTHLEENVEKEYGAEVLQKLKGPNKDEVVVSGHVDENGETVVDSVASSVNHDAYSILFDETNSQWTKNASMNRDFLERCEKWANQLLRAKGFLFLNEVLKLLNYDDSELTQEGQIVGWRYYDDPAEAIAHNSRNEVKFGVLDKDKAHTPEELAFLEGKERNVWLTFNVDPEPIIGYLRPMLKPC